MENNEEKLPATISEYKGNPIISIPLGNNERYSFSFGLTKAKAIMEYLDDIKGFIEKMEAKESAESTEAAE
ncbi:MAG: hypothetical protein ACEPO8_02315 [Rhodothermaceae bacterium]